MHILLKERQIKAAARFCKRSEDYRAMYNVILCKFVAIKSVENTPEAKRAYIEGLLKRKLVTQCINRHKKTIACYDPLRWHIGLMDD